MRRVALIALCACASSAPLPTQAADDVRVEAVAVDLQPEGRGTVGFVLDLASKPGESCTVTQVEWSLALSEHDFATGLSAMSVLVPGGQRARVKIEEPIAFGGMSYDNRPRTVPAVLRGEVVTRWSWGEEKKRFLYRTRVAVRGAPVWDR